ncbi:hypothetical protein [Labrys miyagiensis]
MSVAAVAVVGVAGCKTTSSRHSYSYPAVTSAPPEPGQTTFRRQRPIYAPPEPGQTTFQGSGGDDGPPEPGQSTFD